MHPYTLHQESSRAICLCHPRDIKFHCCSFARILIILVEFLTLNPKGKGWWLSVHGLRALFIVNIFLLFPLSLFRKLLPLKNKYLPHILIAHNLVHALSLLARIGSGKKQGSGLIFCMMSRMLRHTFLMLVGVCACVFLCVCDCHLEYYT